MTFSWLPLCPSVVIGAALIAGLAAAYGRELQLEKRPSLRWWSSRVLLMPCLVIGSIAITQALLLSESRTARCAGMLALGGYDGLRLLEQQWRARFLLARSEQGSVRQPLRQGAKAKPSKQNTGEL